MRRFEPLRSDRGKVHARGFVYWPDALCGASGHTMTPTVGQITCRRCVAMLRKLRGDVTRALGER